MSKPTQNPKQYAAGRPIQSGVTPEQRREMREEIAHSGVASSEKDGEESATPGRETGDDDSSASLPIGNVGTD